MAATAGSSSSAQTSLPLGKYLASTGCSQCEIASTDVVQQDKKTRDKAIKNLTTFLSQSAGNKDTNGAPLSKSEMAKLWKGIFYCFWMSDKPLVQQALATEIAEILLVIPNTAASLTFLRGFWEATVREWAGIDRLRIDKYYMFIRRFTNASFRLLQRESWDNTLVGEYNSILTDLGGPLCPEDVKVPSSLPYHLADIYLEELDKALTQSPSSDSSDPPTPPAPLTTLLDPFISLAARTPAKLTVQRIESALLEPLFDALDCALPSKSQTEKSDDENADGEEEEENNTRSRKRPRLAEDPEFPNILAHSLLAKEGGDEASTVAQLKKVLLKRLFEVASEDKTRDANRRKMYKFWKARADDVDEAE
ncbi:nucleolar protein,Nop52-domain-containing protein [Irpex rosettiformis]|uniref:Nucleolar protein,Nop52-domain-containing protein n=1 Tax=Irpex rosettiformis TaxID=378272 RepID=A0ACB8UJ28_9APHY|nr:nucleolar protein,Nop52-domain-containing protein [Irpex rosettiformis]